MDNVLLKALQLEANMRFSNVKEFREAFMAACNLPVANSATLPVSSVASANSVTHATNNLTSQVPAFNSSPSNFLSN